MTRRRTGVCTAPSDEAWLDAFMSSDAQQWAVRHAAQDMAMYRGTGNARFVWRAFMSFREVGLPIPEDILAVFDRWARSLSSGDGPAETLRAMDLGGGPRTRLGSTQVGVVERETVIAREVDRLRALKGIGPTVAIRQVAAMRLMPEPEVRKAYYRRRAVATKHTKTKRRA